MTDKDFSKILVTSPEMAARIAIVAAEIKTAWGNMEKIIRDTNRELSRRMKVDRSVLSAKSHKRKVPYEKPAPKVAPSMLLAGLMKKGK